MTTNDLKKASELYQEYKRLDVLFKDLKQENLVVNLTVGGGQPHYISKTMRANLLQSAAIERQRAKQEFEDFIPHNQEVM